MASAYPGIRHRLLPVSLVSGHPSAASSGAGAVSKAAAGHGTPAVAHEVQPNAWNWNPGEARIGIQAPVAQESDRGFPPPLPAADVLVPRRATRTFLRSESHRWAKGVGLQCTRFPQPGARVCGRHCKFQTHGLVTGDIPPAKLREFLSA